MAPAPEFRHILVPRDFSDGYFYWLKWIFISIFLILFAVFFIRIIYWYYVYDQQQREIVHWYRWNSHQRQERMRQQQQQQHARQQHQNTLRRTAWERQQHRHTRPNMRATPVPQPQPAVLRMHIVTPPPPQPPPPQPVNLMFVMVNVPDTENDDGVRRGETRNAQTPSSPTQTNPYRRDGITRVNEGSERGHQRTPSRASSRNQTRRDREHQRTPSRTQSRAETNRQAIDQPPPPYQP
ncbi:hypothetical protein TWF718_002950 [Orbilia javanica]|uniref:Uncharacterized protein n=1 Tax=Orbilia javanica TaxID=47235 RepID=A0AAN8NL64_9PEZI